MQFKKMALPGCYEIVPPRFVDERGYFFKSFHRDIFARQGLEISFAEQYTTCSKQGVLRGLHFQLPPHDHAKLVYCLTGEVLDGVVDLRIGSPTYGQYEVVTLSAEKGSLLYLPAGMAHGFYVTSSEAILSYCVTSVHAPESDAGIAWNSAGIPWPASDPILSSRDRGFVALKDFMSPFRFEPDCYRPCHPA